MGAVVVNSLLYPAIGLMNRLSFGMKFSLISVLFFIPMLATNFYLVRGSYAQYGGTRIEQESLGVLGDALQLRRALEQWNDLAQLDALIGQSGNAQGLDARLSETRSAVGERLAALRPVEADAEQVAEFTARLDELKAAVAAVQAEQSLQSRVPMVGKLLGQSQVLIRLIASQSGLSQDAERDIRQMSELLTTVTPAISEALAQGRATAPGPSDRVSQFQCRRQLDALVVELERLHGQYAAQLQEALASGPEARSRLEAIGAASLQSLKTSADLIQDEVIVANDLNQPWGRFFDAFSGEMAKTYRLNDATLDYLDSRLQARLEHKRLQMIGLLAALLLVFVLIVYLYAPSTSLPGSR